MAAAPSTPGRRSTTTITTTRGARIPTDTARSGSATSTTTTHAWYPNAYSSYGGYGYGAGGYGYPGYYPGRAFSDFDTGYLRLRVSPRQAQVFVDGYFAGEVDDYDGIVQGLKLESGTYHIEIVAPGYETLEFDVRIIPGQKIQYRGDLRRVP